MAEPLAPIVLYTRLVDASADLSRYIGMLHQHDPSLAAAMERAWLHLDDLIEQLPEALAADAQRQAQEHDVG